MKILLVNPPIPKTYYNREYYISSSLMYLGAVLKKNGEEVKILDLKTFNFTGYTGPQDFYDCILLDTIADFRPQVIGIGGLYSGNFPDVLRFSRVIKAKFEEIPIVIGGIHATIYPYEILSKCPTIDWIVLGEGEESVVRLADAIKSRQYDFKKIDGFAYRKNGEVFINPKTHYIEDLDSIPFPAYELINLQHYYVDTSDWHNPKNLPINTSIPIITSRSCPNRCNFCSMFMVMGPRWRARSPQNVVNEIEYLYKKYNHRHFSFMDDNLTFKKTHIMGICSQIIKRKLDIQFETPNGISINTLDEEVLDAMVEAGMVRVCLAIESGSDFMRNKIIKKRLSREKILETVRITRKYKHLYVKAFFIIGMPEETPETLNDTYEMIKEVKADRIYLQSAVPFPGTKIFEQALRDNLFVDLDPKDFYKSDALYGTNYERFFIKPYSMDLVQLHAFRAKCNALIAQQQAENKALKEVTLNK